MATNKINGKSYIGQTVKSLECRKGQHINDALQQRNNMYFGRAIRKDGPDNFDWQILHDGIINIDDLNKLEIYYIQQYNTFENGYNLTEGGGGTVGLRCSKETKRKMSESRKGKYAGKDHCMFGKQHSKESRKKMSAAKKGKKNPNYGKHRSNETKKRISEANKGEKHPMYGKHLSTEIKEKISISGKGRKFSDSHKQKISESQKGRNNSVAKAVIIGNQYFDTLRKAAIFLKVTPSTIRYRILHKTKWLDYRYAEGEYNANL